MRNALLLFLGVAYIAVLIPACSDKETAPDLTSDSGCRLVEVNDAGYILTLSYDNAGNLVKASSNFSEEYNATYNEEGDLKQVSGALDIRLVHDEGSLPERVEFWNGQAMAFHYTMEEQNGLLTEWRSFPNGATNADRIVSLTYKNDRIDGIGLQLYDEDSKTYQLVMEADSIKTDGRINPFSSETLLFILFVENKPFALSKENITEARIQVLGQEIPFSTEYIYNEYDLLTSSTVEVQLFGGQTTFSYDCN